MIDKCKNVNDIGRVMALAFIASASSDLQVSADSQTRENFVHAELQASLLVVDSRTDPV